MPVCHSEGNVVALPLSVDGSNSNYQATKTLLKRNGQKEAVFCSEPSQDTKPHHTGGKVQAAALGMGLYGEGTAKPFPKTL